MLFTKREKLIIAKLVWTEYKQHSNTFDSQNSCVLTTIQPKQHELTYSRPQEL